MLLDELLNSVAAGDMTGIPWDRSDDFVLSGDIALKRSNAMLVRLS